jgi:hypothetical protein
MFLGLHPLCFQDVDAGIKDRHKNILVGIIAPKYISMPQYSCLCLSPWCICNNDYTEQGCLARVRHKECTYRTSLGLEVSLQLKFESFMTMS